MPFLENVQIIQQSFKSYIELSTVLQEKLESDNNGSVYSLFMDPSIIFDTIYHDLLLAKPRAYEVSKDAPTLLSRYLKTESHTQKQCKYNAHSYCRSYARLCRRTTFLLLQASPVIVTSEKPSIKNR